MREMVPNIFRVEGAAADYSLAQYDTFNDAFQNNDKIFLRSSGYASELQHRNLFNLRLLER